MWIVLSTFLFVEAFLQGLEKGRRVSARGVELCHKLISPIHSVADIGYLNHFLNSYYGYTIVRHDD